MKKENSRNNKASLFQRTMKNSHANLFANARKTLAKSSKQIRFASRWNQYVFFLPGNFVYPNRCVVDARRPRVFAELAAVLLLS